MRITVHTIIRSYSEGGSPTETDVLGSFIDEEKARNFFETQKETEKMFSEEFGWAIYSDEDFYYEAGEDGNFNNNFVILYWYKETFDIPDKK